MWQKCPICKGQGFVFNGGTVSEITSTCPICNGQRIISKKTGTPPTNFIFSGDEQRTSITDSNISSDIESFTINNDNIPMSEKMIKYGSTLLPEWANWIAMNKFDIWFCYEKEPRILGDYWENQKHSRYSKLYSSMVVSLGLSTFVKDWKDSLFKLQKVN